MLRSLLCISAVLLLVVCSQLGIVEATMVGCGGFLQSSLSAKVDFSLLKVNLYTESGALKESVECAPNGYYFLPVYDKGTYKLSVASPDGWTFAPAELTVDVNELECHEGKDVNFELTGFRVSGALSGTSLSSCAVSGVAGPSGVQLSLLRDGVAVLQSESTDGGAFTFENVASGQYELRAQHAIWQFVQNTHSFKVQADSVVLEPHLKLTGYDIRGQVLSAASESEPVSGVRLFLFSDEKYEFACAVPSAEDLTSLQDVTSMPVCAIQTNDAGLFQLNGVPCGSYELKAIFQDDHTVFELEPESTRVQVGHGTLDLSEQPFKVVGFTASGRVSDSNGQPIADVEILLEGNVLTKTDSTGMYTLGKMQTGNYSIQARKELFEFSSLSNVRISPNNAHLSDMVLERIHVCGSVMVPRPPIAQLTHAGRKVTARSQSDEVFTANVAADGTYCISLPPNQLYHMGASVSSREEEAGLALHPAKLTVELSTEPVLNADFSQSLLRVVGNVRCLHQPCDDSVRVMLLSVRDPSFSQTVALTAHNSFAFSNLVPGEYEVEIQRPGWCWKEDNVVLSVYKDDTSSLTLVQTGFEFSYESSHAFDLSIEYPSGKVDTKQLQKRGPHKFCVSESGVYTLRPTGCYRFAQETYSFDTATASPATDIIFQAQEYRLQGSVQFEKSSSTVQLDQCYVDVYASATASKPEQTIALQFSEKNVDQEAVFSFFLPRSQSVVLRPHCSDEMVLFYPREQSAIVTSESCKESLKPFAARGGLFLSGVTVPAQADVNVQVYSKRDRELVSSTTTDKAGKYRVGPLYDDMEYAVVGEKENFHCTPSASNPLDIQLFRLGSVLVRVVVNNDGVVSPLSEVLLSLTGGNAYRNNTQVGDDGRLRFVSLTPGQYFLRPLLKEYVFEPSTKAIEVVEGNEAEIEFVATRVAYSCFGQVRSLAGHAVPKATVQARAGEGEFEETVSDRDGNYRLRGLKPGVQYEISVLGDGVRVERSSPTTQIVSINADDVHSVNFVSFRPASTITLAGHVVTDVEYLPTLSLHISAAHDPEVVLQTRKLGAVDFFHVSGLSVEEEGYLLRLESSLSSAHSHLISVEDVLVLANQTDVEHLRIPFVASVKQNLEDVSTWPFSILLLLVALVLGVIYRHELREAYSNYKEGTLFLSEEELASRREQLTKSNTLELVNASKAAHRRGYRNKKN